jgi:hypothetical protein
LLGSVVNAAVNAAAQEQTPPPAAPNPTPTPDQMRMIKGDSPAPEVYDYVPGYANPQDMNMQSDLEDYRRRGSLSGLGKSLASLFTRNPKWYGNN